MLDVAVEGVGDAGMEDPLLALDDRLGPGGDDDRRFHCPAV
jgi:hypothetical protein